MHFMHALATMIAEICKSAIGYEALTMEKKIRGSGKFSCQSTQTHVTSRAALIS